MERKNYIRKKLLNFKPEFINCTYRLFDEIIEAKDYCGALSNSVILYICAKKYGYKPKLCYGLCNYNGKDFYHAWVEIKNTIIDLSIYGSTNYGLPSKWFNKKMDTPYIGPYGNEIIHYGKFVFDIDWNDALIAFAQGMSFEEYMDGLPNEAMWILLCNTLGEIPSEEKIKAYRKLIKNDII